MTREQLLAMGFTEEQVNQIMALHGQATQGLNATIQQNNGELQRLRGIETQYNSLVNQQPSPSTEPENPELENALQRIAELEAENTRKDISVYAASKGLSGEQVQKVLSSFQNNYELAVSAIDSISQIISDKEKAAATAKEQEIAGKAGNPNGASGGGADNKSTAENIATKLFGGQKQENNILKHYVNGGN